MDKPPQPTDRLIKRLRRHARALKRNLEKYRMETRNSPDMCVAKLSPEAVSAISNTAWQAAGRLEDLAEARTLLETVTNNPLTFELRETVVAFLERTEGIDRENQTEEKDHPETSTTQPLPERKRCT